MDRVSALFPQLAAVSQHLAEERNVCHAGCVGLNVSMQAKRSAACESGRLDPVGALDRLNRLLADLGEAPLAEQEHAGGEALYRR